MSGMTDAEREAMRRKVDADNRRSSGSNSGKNPS